MRWWPAATAVDLSQRIDRLSVGFDNQLPTICPSSRFWLLPDNKNKRRKYEHRFLLGREALHIQGFPVEWLKKCNADDVPSENQLADLAGNAFTSCVVLRVLIGLLLIVGKRAAASNVEIGLDYDEIADLMNFGKDE